MSYIKGKFKNYIFESDSGYKIGLFRVSETDDEDIDINKTITFTGYFADINKEEKYTLYGNYIFHNRYGYQFQVNGYEKNIPEGKEAIIDFLTSSFVKGCGEVVAKKIYELFGEEALEKIKENKDNLLLVPKMTDKKATSIYNSVVKYFDADKEILELKNMGFSVKETMNLMNTYGKKVLQMIENDIYFLTDTIDFKKLDNIFLKTHDLEDSRRIKACIIESMKNLTFANGDIYLTKDEIIDYLKKSFRIMCEVDNYFLSLQRGRHIIRLNDKYYLINDYLDELNNATCISALMNKKTTKIKNFDKLIKDTEKDLKIKYNEEQISAIKCALENNISIITGGPGTGKTTIIKGILKMYEYINKISSESLFKHVCLLAPTGRASKRMMETSGIPSSTIHRFLKWDKENNVFNVNETCKEHFNLFIIDEVSMLDNHLLSSLFKGIDINTKIVFVGDEYQLPSVGPGLILSDMIKSGVNHMLLKNIYRQSDNSYIPVLAKNIKDKVVTDEVLEKKDDYNFIVSSSKDIKEYISKILLKVKDKKIDISKVQVLAPMYKGENGIDNLNILLQEIFNPAKPKKDEIRIGPITYRVGDKILNLVNDVDNNIYNGDIGYIEIVIKYDNKTKVSYKRENLTTITHAYAISIHKSQGSEFEHVIMPITAQYSRMLYNKLLYTGVSRAKKSLVLIGSIDAFNKCIMNNYSQVRKTTLADKIMNILKETEQDKLEV